MDQTSREPIDLERKPPEEHHDPERGENILALFVWNLFAALVWVAAWGEFTLANLVLGFLLGYAMLWLGQGMFSSTEYCGKLARTVEFIAFFLWELVLANLRVAWDVLTPRMRAEPGILAVPLDAETDLEITLLASFLSLTPDTLALDISPDRKVMYVHAMYFDDPEKEKQRIKTGFERRLLEITR